MSHMAYQLVGALRPLVDALEKSSQPKAAGKRVASIPLATQLQWPDDLRPVHLAGADNMVAALSRDRRGALVKVMEPSTGGVTDLTAFELLGLDTLGDVSGGSLLQSGLIVTMDSGAIAECSGFPVDGAWFCQQVGPKLPSFGSSMTAAVASRTGTTQLRAAVTLGEGEEGTLLLLETETGSSSWLPVGEVGLPAVRDQVHLSLSPAADAVFISAGTGEVLKWAFGSPEPTEQVFALPGGLHTKWHAACPLGDSHVVHLATQPTEAAPKMYVRATGE